MLNKEVYNKTGLIYGIGHAVYTISDPRALLLKELARDLAREKAEKANLLFLNCWKNVPSLLSDGLKQRKDSVQQYRLLFGLRV